VEERKRKREREREREREKERERERERICLGRHTGSGHGILTRFFFFVLLQTAHTRQVKQQSTDELLCDLTVLSSTCFCSSFFCSPSFFHSTPSSTSNRNKLSIDGIFSFIFKENPALERVQTDVCATPAFLREQCEQAHGVSAAECERYQQEEKKCFAFHLCPKLAEDYYGSLDGEKKGKCSFLLNRTKKRPSRQRLSRCHVAAKAMNQAINDKLAPTRQPWVLGEYEDFLRSHQG